jgi:hypothetical protein
MVEITQELPCEGVNLVCLPKKRANDPWAWRFTATFARQFGFGTAFTERWITARNDLRRVPQAIASS